MPRYKKKISTIDAVQFDEGVRPLPDGVVELGPSSYMLMFNNPEADIAAGGAGGLLIEHGDWIVTENESRVRHPADDFDNSFVLDVIVIS